MHPLHKKASTRRASLQMKETKEPFGILDEMILQRISDNRWEMQISCVLRCWIPLVLSYGPK